jgi:acid stress-induced BolA-like protein IbaG/YrbA
MRGIKNGYLYFAQNILIYLLAQESALKVRLDKVFTVFKNEAGMISPDQVEIMIKTALPEAQINVQSPDGEHFEVTVVASQFEGKRRVQQHQLVYGAVKEAMATEAIHALALNTFTPAEWATKTA